MKWNCHISLYTSVAISLNWYFVTCNWTTKLKDSQGPCGFQASQEAPLLYVLLLASLQKLGRCPNGNMGLSWNDRTILFLVILLDKTVSVG